MYTGDILQAAKWSACGYAVTSCKGKRYKPDKFGVRWAGNHYASFSSVGMVDEEVKGTWSKGEYEGGE